MLSRDPERLLRTVAEGKPVRLPRRCDLGVVASLFEPLSRGDHARSPLPPDAGVLRALVRFCRSETDLLTAQDASRFADALLALSAQTGSAPSTAGGLAATTPAASSIHSCGTCSPPTTCRRSWTPPGSRD